MLGMPQPARPADEWFYRSVILCFSFPNSEHTHTHAYLNNKYLITPNPLHIYPFSSHAHPYALYVCGLMQSTIKYGTGSISHDMPSVLPITPALPGQKTTGTNFLILHSAVHPTETLDDIFPHAPSTMLNSS